MYLMAFYIFLFFIVKLVPSDDYNMVRLRTDDDEDETDGYVNASYIHVSKDDVCTSVDQYNLTIIVSLKHQLYVKR